MEKDTNARFEDFIEQMGIVDEAEIVTQEDLEKSEEVEEWQEMLLRS